MMTMPRVCAAAVILLFLLSIYTSAVEFPSPSTSVIDPYLYDKMEKESSMEIIVQFMHRITNEDRCFLRSIGLEIKREYHAIPAIYTIASADQINKLSHYYRTKWIEYNEKLQFFMDKSLTTINATKTWDSRIVDNMGIRLGNIDGTGVTAVVVDSGIDAGHPDLDYGEKTIMNLKSDMNGVWVETENSDTSSGHGTHCAGTIAGNGDASGGCRKGVAPGARLIGLSTGEAVAIVNALGALEWVYDHSRPNANPYNIRVVSNSWGTTSEYNHDDAIVQICEKITYENNVVVVFAAGNEGEDDHDGHEVTTNPYSLTPCVISVAAIERDGSGVAYFSSRGSASDNFTWPDIGAPGVDIWSTEARRTLITALKQGDGDAYYMAISGTSMATPHVAGLVALLWQAAPSMKVSNVHDDYSNGSQYDPSSYWNDSYTRIHEAELILKLTADYIEPNDDNGVPENFSYGVMQRKNDFAQGYGLVNAYHAVGLALTLEEMRKTEPNATVFDAYAKYMNFTGEKFFFKKTDTLKAHWHGEWARLDGANGTVMYTDQQRYLYIPENATKLIIEMQYVPVDTEERYAGSLTVKIDWDLNGDWDYYGDRSFSTTGYRKEEIDVQSSGGMLNALWAIDIEASGFGLKPIFVGPPGFGVNQYPEVMIEYDISAYLTFNSTNDTVIIDYTDYGARFVQWEFGEPSPDYAGGVIGIKKFYYNLSNVWGEEEELSPPPKVEIPCMQYLLLGILAIALSVSTVYMWLRKRGMLLQFIGRKWK